MNVDEGLPRDYYVESLGPTDRSPHPISLFDEVTSFVSMDLSSNVQRLAIDVFDAAELSEVRKIAEAFSDSRKQKKLAILRLREIVPKRPKRPLYYVNYEVKFLPRSSRFLVEQMGSYLDLLVKELRYELEGQYHREPLGKNISALMKRADTDMKLILRRIQTFNEVAYVPAKHAYGPPSDPKHLFSSQESVVITLAAVKLGEELKSKSKYVRNLCQDLVLPAQKPLSGKWKRTDHRGMLFDFKEKLLAGVDDSIDQS